MASIEEKLKKAHKRFRERGKYLSELQRENLKLEIKNHKLKESYDELKARYIRECQIKMEYIPEKRAFAFFNYITKEVFICDKEPEKMARLY